MRTSWKLINQELGNNCKNYGFQQTTLKGSSIKNHHTIANAFNNHFTTFPVMISRKISASNCFTKTSANKQHTFAFSLHHDSETHFPVLSTTVPPLEKLRI